MSAAPQPPAPRRRRWLRRALWLGLLLVAARLVLALGVGPLARFLARGQGLQLAYERLDLDLFQGRVELWRLDAAVLADEGEPRPLLGVQTLALDVDTRALLRGHVRVRRLELDGVQVELTRDAGGAWNVDPLVARFLGGAQDEPRPEEPYEPHPLALEPPLELVAARAQNLSVHLRDEQADPPLDATLTVSLSAADIGSPGRRAHLDLVATSPEVLDLLRCRGTGNGEGARGDLVLDLALSGLRLRPLAHLLAPLGIEPVAERLDGGLALSLRAAPVDEAGERVTVALELRDAHLDHDGREALALDSLRVDVAEAWPRGARARSVLVDGLRASAQRLPDGAPALAGLAWRGRPTRGAAVEPPASAGNPDAATTDAEPAGPPTGEAFAWSIDDVTVRGGRLALDDRALEPRLETAALLEELTLGPLSSAPDAPAAELALSAALPGVLERARVTGSLRPFAAVPELSLRLEAEGVEPTGLAPYLALAGLEPALEDGRLRAQAVLGATGQGGQRLALRGLALDESGGQTGERRELGAIDTLTLDLTPDAPPSLVVEGARLRVSREPGDTLTLLGLRLGAAPAPPRRARTAPAATRAAGALDTANATPSPAAFAIPRLDLPAARIRLDTLELVDEASGSPPLLLGPLSAALAPAEASTPDARAHLLALDAPETPDSPGPLARELSADLRLEQAASGALSLAGDARASGLDLEPLRPWLALAGLEPALEEGAFEGALTLALEARDGRPVLDLGLGPLQLRSGAGEAQREWLGLEHLAVERMVLGDGLAIDALRVAGPRLFLRRDADGGLCALGLRLPPPEPQRAASAEERIAAARAETAALATDTAGGSDAQREAAEPAPASGPPASPLRLARFELSGASARFEDHALGGGDGRAAAAAPQVLAIGGALRLEDLEPGPGAGPTALEGRLEVGPATLDASGQLVLDPRDLRASLTLAGDGLSGAPLAPWLSPGVSIALQDGVAAAHLEARLARAPEGGHAATLRLEAAELRERGAERPLAALSSLRLDAPRIDPAERVLDVEELALEGSALDVLRGADGSLEVLGLRLAPAPRPPAGAASAGAEPAAGASVASDASDGPATPGTTAGPASGPRATHLRLGRLALELAELRVTSAAHPAAPPSLSSARLDLRAPFELVLDPEDEQPVLPSIGLDLAASVAPGIGSLALGLDLAPFADRPRLDGTLAVRGIDGAGLTALLPELADRLDPGGLSEGTFDATLALELDVRRRDPLELDLGAGFGAELSLRDVALRRSPGAEVDLGVDGVQALARRIAPRSGLVHVTRVEVDTPRGRLRHTPEGLELAGLVLRLPDDQGAAGPAEAPSAGVPVPDEATEPAPEPAQPVAAAAAEVAPQEPAGPSGELRLDELLVHGLDLRVEDTTCDPPFVLPLEALELDVKGLSSRALVEPRPIRVSASLGAGEVSVPERLESVSLLRGLASGALSAVAGSDEELSHEERPFFQEASLGARLTLAPHPTGWVRLSLSAFELAALRGLARQSGIEIGDGLLDFQARVQLEGEQGGEVELDSTFRYLSLSEPDGGPISRFLKLPAPLDTVLFALEDEQDEHHTPLSFDFGRDGDLGVGQIAAQASRAFLGLITDALASAPMRAVGGATDLVGLGGLLGGGDGKPEYAGLTVTIPFPPGDVRFRAAEREALAEIVEGMREDPRLELQAFHVFGPADVEQAARLASPDSREAANLLRSLVLEREALEQRRDRLAAEARALLLFAEDERFAATREELLGVCRELGLTEAGIDRVAELLRQGAESRKDSRTREAALTIARARLDSLARALLDLGVPWERTDLRPPRLELPSEPEDQDAGGRIVLVTRGGTPPKGFLRRVLGWVGL